MEREIIVRLRNLVAEIPRDKRVATELDISSNVFVSALKKKVKGSYYEYKLPNTVDEVLLYWLNDKYDELEENVIANHYKSGIKFVYDNGIRSVDYEGSATLEEDVEDVLYIQVDSVPDIENTFSTVEKRVAHITPHIDAITVYVYDVIESTGNYELISERVLGYKVTDVDTVVGELQSDWKSNQLIGNLFKIEVNV